MSFGRNSHGQFEKGNSFGTGRRVSELRKAFIDAITPDDVQAIVQAIIQKAKDGDLKAVQICLPYIIGAPMKQEEVRKELNIDEASPIPECFKMGMRTV